MFERAAEVACLCMVVCVAGCDFFFFHLVECSDPMEARILRRPFLFGFWERPERLDWGVGTRIGFLKMSFALVGTMNVACYVKPCSCVGCSTGWFTFSFRVRFF